jgi:hypothetical protein
VIDEPLRAKVQSVVDKQLPDCLQIRLKSYLVFESQVNLEEWNRVNVWGIVRSYTASHSAIHVRVKTTVEHAMKALKKSRSMTLFFP